MTEFQKSIAQFDAQTNDKVLAHISLSNMYLAIESGRSGLFYVHGGRKYLTGAVQKLYQLLNIVYPKPSFIRKYWLDEFKKLPDWQEIS